MDRFIPHIEHQLTCAHAPMRTRRPNTGPEHALPLQMTLTLTMPKRETRRCEAMRREMPRGVTYGADRGGKRAPEVRRCGRKDGFPRSGPAAPAPVRSRTCRDHRGAAILTRLVRKFPKIHGAFFPGKYSICRQIIARRRPGRGSPRAAWIRFFIASWPVQNRRFLLLEKRLITSAPLGAGVWAAVRAAGRADAVWAAVTLGGTR